MVLFFASFGFNLLLSLLTFLLLRKRSAEPVPEPDEHPTAGRITWRQALTLALLLALVVGALGFHLEIGFLALAAGALLSLVDMKNQAKAIDGISWSTILLVAGMVTYVTILEKPEPSTCSPTRPRHSAPRSWWHWCCASSSR